MVNQAAQQSRYPDKRSFLLETYAKLSSQSEREVSVRDLARATGISKSRVYDLIGSDIPLLFRRHQANNQAVCPVTGQTDSQHA